MDSVGESVTAGFAAASAAMGKALASIRDEDDNDGDAIWSEEADSNRTSNSPSSNKMKTVAIVVSAGADALSGGSIKVSVSRSLYMRERLETDCKSHSLYCLVFPVLMTSPRLKSLS